MPNEKAESMKRPNILLFITDQHRADYLGCYGHPVLKTPHIDSISARSIRFRGFDQFIGHGCLALFLSRRWLTTGASALRVVALGWQCVQIAGWNAGEQVAEADLAGADAVEGVYVSLIAAVDTMNTPAVKKANDILAKYSPQTRPGYYSYLGMAGVIIMVEAMNRAGRDLTRSKLIGALESLGHFDPGVVPPIDWNVSYHGGSATFGYAVWRSGKLSVLQGW
jgi:hypothetical protein